MGLSNLKSKCYFFQEMRYVWLLAQATGNFVCVLNLHIDIVTNNNDATCPYRWGTLQRVLWQVLTSILSQPAIPQRSPCAMARLHRCVVRVRNLSGELTAVVCYRQICTRVLRERRERFKMKGTHRHLLSDYSLRVPPT